MRPPEEEQAEGSGLGVLGGGAGGLRGQGWGAEGAGLGGKELVGGQFCWLSSGPA